MKLWQETFGQAQSKWQLAGWLLAFAFPVFALVLDKAASTIYAVFFLAGLWLLMRGRHEKLDPLLRWVLIAFATYFLVGVLSFFLGEQTRLGEKILGRDIRFIAATSVAFVVVALSLPGRLRALSFALGGMVTGAVAVIEVLLSDRLGYRAGGETISILFGHLAAALALINVAFVLHSSTPHRYMFLLAAFSSAAALLLSGTRGAILGIVAVLFALAVHFIHQQGITWRRMIAVAGILVILAGVLIGSNPRVEGVLSEISDFRRQAAITQRMEWPALPACFNDAGFLQWLVDNSITSGAAELEIEVRAVESKAAWKGANFSCSGGHQIVIRNPDEQHVGWIYLPERSVSHENYDAALIARGHGQLSLALMPREKRTRVDSEQPLVVELDSSLSEDSRYLLLFGPGDELGFAPVVFSESEYAFSNQTSSVGSRLLMWEGAVQAFFDNPVLGRGTGSFPQVLRERAESGLSPWQLTDFDHAHNEILTVAAERGILGLITLFGVYAAPFWLFWRRRDVFGHAGMAFVASIFISGLTETIFNHSLGITYYCMLVLLLATAPRESPGEAARPDMPSDKLI